MSVSSGIDLSHMHFTHALALPEQVEGHLAVQVDNVWYTLQRHPVRPRLHSFVVEGAPQQFFLSESGDALA